MLYLLRTKGGKNRNVKEGRRTLGGKEGGER